MMKETDIFNDESLQNDIQDLAAIEQAMIRKKYPLPDLDAELEAIVEKEEVPETIGPHTMWRTMFAALMGAAAMLVLVFVWQWSRSHFDKTSDEVVAMNAGNNAGMATIQTADDELVSLTLADGTKVQLNSNSKITYPHQFKGTERMIHLEGEAFFDVKHDAHRPFIVEAGGVLTKDLGTSFNIKVYKNSELKVTLVEGKIEVQSKDSKQKPVVLAPGQQYSLSGRQNSVGQIQSVDTEEATAWKDGVIYYHDQTLFDIASDLASKYHVKVDFRNQRAKSLHLDFSASKNGTLDETVSLLNDLGVAKVELKGNTMVIE